MVLALESKVFPPTRVPANSPNRASSEVTEAADSTRNAAQAFLNGIGNQLANRRIPQQGQDFFDSQDRPRRANAQTERVADPSQRPQQAANAAQQFFANPRQAFTSSPVLAPSSTLLFAQQLASEEQDSTEPTGLKADQGYNAYIRAGAQNGTPQAAQEATLRPAEARGQTAIFSPIPTSYNFAI